MRYSKAAAIAGAFIAGGMYGLSQFFGQATKTGKKQHYPADDLIGASHDNDYSLTHAIMTDAPTYVMWRSFKQIGCSKSGSSSTEFVERALTRLSFHNSYEVQEEFQQPDSLMPGDIAAFDSYGMSMEWADVVSGRYLVQWADTKNPLAAPGSCTFRFPDMTHFVVMWCLYVVPLKGDRTCLINHWCIGYKPAAPLMKTLNWANIEFAGRCTTNI